MKRLFTYQYKSFKRRKLFLKSRTRKYSTDLNGNLSHYTPSSSIVEKTLLFASDPNLKFQWISFYGGVRIGLLLEQLDLIAGATSYKYTLGRSGDIFSDLSSLRFSPMLGGETVTIVTASCGRLELYRELPIDNDLKILGMVTNVGKSSIDVEVDVIELMQEPRTILRAHFTLVARTSSNTPFILPPLNIQSAEEKKRQEESRARREEKLRKKKFSS